MSFSDEERTFLQQACLKLRIPADASDSNTSEQHGNSDDAVPPDLEADERDVLFFDEQLKIYVALELPQCRENQIQSLLSRLAIKVDVWAIDDSPSPQDGKPPQPAPRDLIYSEKVAIERDPLTLIKEDGTSEPLLCLVWDHIAVLNRPRSRLASPVITVIANGTLRPVKSENEVEYLPSMQPLEANILEPLASLAADGMRTPYLPVSRLERVLPVRPNEVEDFRLRHEPSQPIKVFPALIARMRYTRIKTPTPTPTTIASLDIEVIPFVEVRASIEQADISLAAGRAEPLMSTFLPMECQSKDCISFLYKLHPNSTTDTQRHPPHLPSTNPNIDILSITLSAKIHLSPTSQPIIKISWSANVDFTQALNPSFGPPSQPIQRTNRPISLPINSDQTTTTTQTPSTTTITSLQPSTSPLTPLGITITFTSPNKPTKCGIPFTWTVLVLNTSPSPIKLALIPLPRIHRSSTQLHNYTKRHAPKTSLTNSSKQSTPSVRPTSTRSLPHPGTTTAAVPNPTHRNTQEIAPAVVEETHLYTLHHANAAPYETDLISLTSELRIGPLGPGQCHECEVVMVALKTGVFSVDAMRVVNLSGGPRGGNGSGEVNGGGGGGAEKVSTEGGGNVARSTNTQVVVDIRDLPDVICEV